MGHFEPEYEHYDPVTDRLTRGPEKYVLDEDDLEKKWEKAEYLDLINSINSIKGYDYSEIRDLEERINNSRHLDGLQKSSLLADLRYHIRYLKDIYERSENRKIQERERQAKERREDRKARRVAFENAKKRYESLSVFGKLKYHKQRPRKIDSDDYTVNELNQLYRGR